MPTLLSDHLKPLEVASWTWDEEAVCGKSLKGEKVYSNDYNEQWAVKFKIPNRGDIQKNNNNKFFYELPTIINAQIGKVYTHKRKGISYSEGCIAN